MKWQRGYIPLVCLRAFLSAAYLLVAWPAAADEITCGSLKNAFGPFDYRKTTSDLKELVEGAHFTPDVESLKRGATGAVGGDLDYTLRAFPNHPRALASMMALQLRSGKERPVGARWSMLCYFDRAIRLAPDDGRVRTTLGVYLMRLGKTEEAIDQFNNAASLGEDGVNLHYNAGLAYFDIGDYTNSLEHAKKAYALGFTLPGLKNKLEKIGKWTPD